MTDFFEVYAGRAPRIAASDMRENNKRLVMSVVAGDPGISAAQIARGTGLGAQTVSRLLLSLEDEGLIRRDQLKRGQRGQPAVEVRLNPNGAYCIGCEIGWRQINILICDLTGKVVGQHKRHYAFPRAREVVQEVSSLAQLLGGLVPLAYRGRIIGLGLATSFGFARNIGRLGGSSQDAEDWSQIDIVRAIQARSGYKVALQNDGNAACWAQLNAMPFPRPENLMFIHLGTFIGGGLIAQGRLWEGPSGNAANIGAMLVRDEAGRAVMMHMVASIFALEERLRAAGIAVPPGPPGEWNWDGLEPVLSNWLDVAAGAIAQNVANAMALVEFSTAIIDGPMPRPVLDRIVAAVRSHLEALPATMSGRPDVVAGLLGDDAAARGAALKPIYRRYLSLDPGDVLRSDDPFAGR